MIIKLFLILFFLYISFWCIKKSSQHRKLYHENKAKRFEAIKKGASVEKENYGSIIEQMVADKIGELQNISNLRTNVQIEHNGYKCELDALFFHNQNFYVAEVKGYNGNLSKGAHGEIIQTSNGGTKTVRNPYSQTRRSIQIIKSMLKSLGINIWIHELIILPTEAVVDKNIEDTTPLIRTFYELENVVNKKSRGVVNQSTQENILKALNLTPL